MIYYFYIIKCYTTNKVYIGSTKHQNLKLRLNGHIQDYKRSLYNNHYCYSSRNVLLNDNYDINLLYSKNCNNNIERELIEEMFIKHYKDYAVNKILPFTSKYTKLLNTIKLECFHCNKTFNNNYLEYHKKNCKKNIKNVLIKNVLKIKL